MKYTNQKQDYFQNNSIFKYEFICDIELSEIIFGILLVIIFVVIWEVLEKYNNKVL